MTENSHFKRYSMQGAKHRRSYMEMVKGSGGELYAFIAVDACLEPGPKRPYNFVGLLTQNDTDHLQRLVDESKTAGVNYTSKEEKLLKFTFRIIISVPSLH